MIDRDFKYNNIVQDAVQPRESFELMEHVIAFAL